jgi:7,8-dihydropterin-6-yl-methyl-4-(beta-D-ribofuranosyl)aminobenzene 5'-phosphate synthase
VLALSSPVLIPKLIRRNRAFKQNRSQADHLNRQRLEQAKALELPALDYLEVTVLVDEKAREGYRSDPGVSYLVRTDLGVLLFDVGFGPDRN